MRNNSFFLIFLLPVAFAIPATLGAGFWFKAAVTLSCIFIILLLPNARIKNFSDLWLIVLAFIFSIIGDWFLSHKGNSFLFFAIGIGLYFLAHAGYLAYALARGKIDWRFTIMVLGIYLIFFLVVLMPQIDHPILFVSVLFYLLISCISVGAAINLQTNKTTKWSYFAGIALILISDTVISFKEFTTYQELNFLILPTYYAAHIAITFALTKEHKRTSSVMMQT